MNPQLLSMLVQLGPAAMQFFQGRKQLREGEKMQSELGPRVNYQIPEAATRALGVAERLAAPYEMPGMGARRYNQDLQTQRFLSGALQAGNSQDAMGLLSKGLEAAQMGELKFAEDSAQNYAQRQLGYQTALGQYAGEQRAVNLDQQKDWYERAKATTDMLEAGRKNKFGAAQGLANTAMMAMMYGQNQDKKPTGESDYSFTNPADIKPWGHQFNIFKNLGGNTTQQATSTNSARNFEDGYGPLGVGNFRGRMGKNPSMWDEDLPGLYFNLGMDSFVKPDLSKSGGNKNNFSSGFFNNDLINPVY